MQKPATHPISILIKKDVGYEEHCFTVDTIFMYALFGFTFVCRPQYASAESDILRKEENKRTTRALFYGLPPVNALCRFDTGCFTECFRRFCGSGIL